jgi:hypothetical protein
LKVSKDKSYLLDRLLKYEQPESTSESDSDTSEDEQAQTGGKKRKMEMGSNVPKKKKMLKKQQNVMNISQIEAHLEARNSIPMPSFQFPQEIFDETDDI